MRETIQNNNSKQFHAVSLSGGKDSTAMLLLMIERGMPIDMVLSADTGMEFPEMYAHLAKLDEHLYRERGLHITTLRHPKGFEYCMFDEPKQKPKSLENRARLGIPPYVFTSEERKALSDIQQIFFPEQETSTDVDYTVLNKASGILIDAWAGVSVAYLPPVNKLRIAENAAKQLRNQPVHFGERRSK